LKCAWFCFAFLALLSFLKSPRAIFDVRFQLIAVIRDSRKSSFDFLRYCAIKEYKSKLSDFGGQISFDSRERLFFALFDWIEVLKSTNSGISEFEGESCRIE
jgi:hypothetical protein